MAAEALPGFEFMLPAWPEVPVVLWFDPFDDPIAPLFCPLVDPDP